MEKNNTRSDLDMSKEIWREVKGEPGFYVSNYGRIKRDAIEVHYIQRNQYGETEAVKHLPKKIYKKRRKKGRNSIQINCNEYYVYRLVASNFIRPLLPKEEINHIDGNKMNDRLDNLEICTRCENQDHAVRMGLNTTVAESISIKINGKAYESLGQAARDLGIPRQILSKIVSKGKTSYKGRKYCIEHIERV